MQKRNLAINSLFHSRSQGSAVLCAVSLSLGINYEFTRTINIVMDYGSNFEDANISFHR